MFSSTTEVTAIIVRTVRTRSDRKITVVTGRATTTVRQVQVTDSLYRIRIRPIKTVSVVLTVPLFGRLLFKPLLTTRL